MDQAALCGAAERLCLWFRAHEVANGVDLANYFETAFAYFVDYWAGKTGEEIHKQLACYPGLMSHSRRASRSLFRAWGSTI